MRAILLSLLLTIPLLCSANPPACQRARLLSKEQWRDVANRTPNGNVIIEEAVALEGQEDQNLAPPPDKTTQIDWDQARKLILLGAIRRVFQHHDLSVLLISSIGRRYSTKEPEIDAVWRVEEVVDPCGVFIRNITE